MKWFGQSWGAPACRFEDHAETPIGAPCTRCDEAIRSFDRGVLIPIVGSDEASAFHLDCYLKSIHPCSGCPRCQPDKHPLH